MDINEFRGLITAITFIAFIGVWIWAWSSRRKADFDASAQLPLEEDNSMSSIEQENS